MKDKLFYFAKKLHRTKITESVEFLLRDEAISGKLIIVAVALALIAANSPLMPWYSALLHTEFSIGFGDWILALDIKHWISEGLMAFFFLVVGLELKRELVHGELRHKKTAVLPFAAAIGGMVVPAIIYTAFNFGKETAGGWAIPTATDIALAVGVLALLGNRIPSSVRIFLLALAIVDDILAVIVIAIFYNTGLNLVVVAAMAVIALQAYWLGKLRKLPMWGFVVAGIVLWLLALASGIHPSIAGVVLGFIAPISGANAHGKQIAEKTERAVIPLSTLVVVPLFAFANTGIGFGIDHVDTDTAYSLGAGIIAGLVIGKSLGIFGAAWLMVKMRLARLPNGMNWLHVAGLGALSGVGFTVAIFVTDLSFKDADLVTLSKLSIFAASVLATILGLSLLWFARAISRR